MTDNLQSIQDEKNAEEVLQPDSPPALDTLDAETTGEFTLNPEDTPELLTEGGRMMREELREYTDTSPELTGGDVDADWQRAASSGEEAVGGSVSTPDQNVTEELAAAVGLEMEDGQELDTLDILEERDAQRFELDPESSEDYPEHGRYV